VEFSFVKVCIPIFGGPCMSSRITSIDCDCKFLRWCLRTLVSSGMWSLVVWWKCVDVPEKVVEYWRFFSATSVKFCQTTRRHGRETTVKRQRLSDYLSTQPVGLSFILKYIYVDLLSLRYFNISMCWSVTQRTENIQSTYQYITFCRTLTLSWQ